MTLRLGGTVRSSGVLSEGGWVGMRKMTPMTNCYGMAPVLVQAVAQGLPFLLGDSMTRDLQKVSWTMIDPSLVDPSKLGHLLQVVHCPQSYAQIL